MEKINEKHEIECPLIDEAASKSADEVPLYAVLDKTRTYEESPQRVSGEGPEDVDVHDREEGSDKEDTTSLYAEVDKINAITSSPFNRQMEASNIQLLQHKETGDDHWSSQGGYSEIETDFFSTTSPKFSTNVNHTSQLPINTYPHMDDNKTLVKMYRKNVFFIFMMIMVIIVTIVVFIASSAVIFTKIKSVEDQIMNIVSNTGENDMINIVLNDYNNKSDTIELLSLINTSLYKRVENLEQKIGNQISPVFSCADILNIDSSAPSGLYWIWSPSGIGMQVYCDMTLSCGGKTGGWMRVANIAVDNHDNSCPGDWRLLQIDSSSHYACRSPHDPMISSLNFITQNKNYSYVCGEIVAYTNESMDAFKIEDRGEVTLNTSYVEGISLTYGHPRKHIWTLAIGRNTLYSEDSCPKNGGGKSPPDFVGNNYVCSFHCNQCNDGQVSYSCLWNDSCCCGPREGACCNLEHPCCSTDAGFQFFRNLTQPTTSDIELRVMQNKARNILIKQIKIYVSM